MILAKLRSLFIRKPTPPQKLGHLTVRLSRNIASGRRWWRYVSSGSGRARGVEWVQVRGDGLMIRIGREWMDHVDRGRAAEWRAEAAAALRAQRAAYMFTGGRQQSRRPEHESG